MKEPLESGWLISGWVYIAMAVWCLIHSLKGDKPNKNKEIDK